jgi:hypothetical protein
VRAGIFSCLAFSALTACASPSYSSYRAELDRWRGHHVDELTLAWGPPYRFYPASVHGGAVVQYEVNTRVYKTGATETYTAFEAERDAQGFLTTWRVVKTRSGPGFYQDINCSTFFTLNSDGTVKFAVFGGNGCGTFLPVAVAKAN